MFKLIMYMKFQKILMTGFRDIFSQFVTHNFFFKRQALSLMNPSGTLTSCKISEKTNEVSLRYLKLDQAPLTTEGSGYPRSEIIISRVN